MNRLHAMPRTPHAKAAWALRHPNERSFVRRSFALSVAIHMLFAALVLLLAYWLSFLRFGVSSSVAQSGPAPEQAMTVNLVMTENHPPPTPTPKPVAVLTPPPKVAPIPAPQGLQVLPPVHLKMAVLIPPPTPKPAPVPSPANVAAAPKPQAKPSAKVKPRYVAAHATGAGQTQIISQPRVGTTGLPSPGYPPEALALREGGTVNMQVVFGPDGAVMNAEVRQSSGYSILDASTRNFIYAHWKNAGMANTTIQVPIIYDPDGRTFGRIP